MCRHCSLKAQCLKTLSPLCYEHAYAIYCNFYSCKRSQFYEKNIVWFCKGVPSSEKSYWNSIRVVSTGIPVAFHWDTFHWDTSGIPMGNLALEIIIIIFI